MRRLLFTMAAIVLGVGMWMGNTTSAQAQDYTMGRFFYYPYYYFPHNYWPQLMPPWPEQPGAPYQRPPAYMSYPPFLAPHWRYDLWEPFRHYRGFHFWLDQF
jgi:hypothetical protein